jgi:hypothetical protein
MTYRGDFSRFWSATAQELLDLACGAQQVAGKHSDGLMLHPTIQTLISRLGELTERGEIPWKAYGAGAYRFETEGYLVEVSPEPRFRILDSGEREIERADVAVLKSDREGDWAKRVSDLADGAQRAASGILKTRDKVRDGVPLPAGAGSPIESVTARKLFGAIESFAVSRPPAVQPAPKPAAANPYKPWN